MDYNDIIRYIEDKPNELTNDFYYHAFVYEQEKFIGMINNGIKSQILLGKQALGNKCSARTSSTIYGKKKFI